jgi:hypothetical protein
METLGRPDFGGVGFLDSRCRRRLMPSLELERCEHTQRRVTPLAIVENLQVLEDGAGQLDARAPARPIEQFDLHSTPERFDHRVVETITDGTHRRQQPGIGSATCERPRGELAGSRGRCNASLLQGE